MPNDTDIFGARAGQPKDADIFADMPGAEDSTPAPSVSAKAQTPGELAIQRLKNQGWGTGLPKLAYEIGGKIVDATGIPALGAAVTAIPDALNMAMGSAVGRAAAPLFDAAGHALMRSALKPTLEQVKKGRAGPAVQTMLDEGFNPTAGGVDKMKSKITDLAAEVETAIAKSGATVDTRAVADYVPDAYKRFQSGPNAVPAIEDLGKVQETFLNHPNILGARDIPVQVAHEMKSGYQQAVGDKGYDALKTATTEGEKQIARGLREKTAEAVPAVAEPLARESSIIRALEMAKRRVAVDANKNPIGLGWIGQPWMIPFWMWDRSALGKSLAARALYSGQEQIPANVGRVGGVLAGTAQPPNGILGER